MYPVLVLEVGTPEPLQVYPVLVLELGMVSLVPEELGTSAVVSPRANLSRLQGVATLARFSVSLHPQYNQLPRVVVYKPARFLVPDLPFPVVIFWLPLHHVDNLAREQHRRRLTRLGF